MPELHISRELAWALAWLAGAVATDMVAIPALVMSHGFRRLAWAALSIAAIFASFFCMRRVVTVIPLGVAYALWCVFGIYGTLAIGRICFRQKLSRQKTFGVVLLSVGVVLMSLA